MRAFTPLYSVPPSESSPAEWLRKDDDVR